MDIFTLSAFAVTYAIVCAVPGPGVAAIVARGLGGGFQSAIPMVLGILVGDLVYLGFAAFGLAAIATYFGAVFTVIRYLSAAYLLFIAYRFWTAKPGSEQIGPKAEEHWTRTLFAGLALTLGNPKALVFFLALMPTAVDLTTLNGAGYLQLCAMTLVVIPAVEFTYAALASQARIFLTGLTARRRMNKGAGAIMIGAGIGVAVT